MTLLRRSRTRGRAWIAALLRTRLAAHALLQLPSAFPWAPDDGQIHRVMRSAAIAPHFEIAIAGVGRVAEQWRWLRRAAIAFHANIACLAGGQIGDLARFPGALLGGLDGRAPTEEAAYSGLLDHLLALPGMIAFPILTAASPSFSSQLSWPSFFLQSYVGPMTWFFLRVSSTFWWFSWLIFLVPLQLWLSCSLPS